MSTKEKSETEKRATVDLNSAKEKSEAGSENKDKKTEIVWVNNIKADGGAYKGCPKNDYCQHLVDTGERPQNFIRDYEEEKRFLDYPKLNELIKRKNEVLQKRATPPMYLKCDLKTMDLSTLGKFDVILIDPPLAEYARRAQNSELGLTPEIMPWTNEELLNLRVDLLADTCCFLFLWVGSEEGLDFGRVLLKKWNFRRCEDIVWIKTNKSHPVKKRIFNENTLLQHTKEHCLVGIKGAVKRGADSHFIHANIDTDIIVSEEPPLASTEKPQELYRIIERFCLGRKRIELFGEDHNIRPGWLTLGKSLTNSNFDMDKYNNWFKGDQCYPEVQGYEGGRFVGCTPEIENLRPRSPVRNQNANFLFGGNNSQIAPMSFTPFFPNMNYMGAPMVQNFSHFDPNLSNGNMGMMGNLPSIAQNSYYSSQHIGMNLPLQGSSGFHINSTVMHPSSNFNLVTNINGMNMNQGQNLFNSSLKNGGMISRQGINAPNQNAVLQSNEQEKKYLDESNNFNQNS